MQPLNIYRLNNQGDDRGRAYMIPKKSLDFVDPITEMHYVTMVPGAIRGNHFHENRRELVVLNYESDWELSWQASNKDEIKSEQFTGQGTIVIEIQSKVIHAFKNTGTGLLHLFCYSNHQGQPDDPDTVRIIILT